MLISIKICLLLLKFTHARKRLPLFKVMRIKVGLDLFWHESLKHVLSLSIDNIFIQFKKKMGLSKNFSISLKYESKCFESKALNLAASLRKNIEFLSFIFFLWGFTVKRFPLFPSFILLISSFQFPSYTFKLIDFFGKYLAWSTVVEYE